MPELVNPLAAFREGYATLEGMAQDRASRQAGNALAQGNYQGAQAALYGRGMLTEGMGVQRQQTAMQDREIEAQQTEQKAKVEAAKRSLEMLGNINEAMGQIPAEQRAEYFRTQVVPQLQGMPGVTPEAIAQMTDPSYDWTDRGIATHRALIGQEAEKLTLFNLGDGRGVAAFDSRGQRVEGAGYTPPPDPNADLERQRLQAQIAALQAQTGLRGAQAARARRPAPVRGSGGSTAPVQPSRSYGSGAEPQW